MKLPLIYCFFLLGGCVLMGQTRFRTSEGDIHFNASTPLEDIDAVNSSANAILEAETGYFASVLLIKDFRFRRKLMQEHFNENYMESESYPKAFFKGKLIDFSLDSLNNSPLVFILRGEISIHGVLRQLDAPVNIRKTGNTLYLDSSFLIAPEDHDIRVPRILFSKIAEEVSVQVALELTLDGASRK